MEPTAPEEALPHRRSRGPRRSEETHRAVLDAAEAILAEKGPAGVTFEAVARAAGAGKPTLYRWWRNRTALLLEIYDRRKYAHLLPNDTGALASDLVAMMTGLWRFWRDTPAGSAFAAIIAEAQFDDDARAALAERFSEPNFPLRPLFERALARGELTDPAEARALREFVVAMNWLRLLTGRLDEADAPALVAGLLGERTSRPRDEETRRA
ncbi:MAG: TetR/AcrR family transcriptional regulator [Hyphomicrobiales bacterium]|nr:TetR/AcrR family transcriptional regulator [Hyphomicrobiales bacterium]